MTKPTDMQPVAVRQHRRSNPKKRGRNLLWEGSVVKIQGRSHVIQRIEGEIVVMRDNRGRISEKRVVDLLLDKRVRLPEEVVIDTSRSVRELDQLTPEQKQICNYWVGHINEVFTGHPSGRTDLTPRPGYERHLTLRQRQQNKANELRCSIKRIQRHCARQIQEGDIGHLDARTTRPTQRFKSVDHRVTDALRIEIEKARKTGTTTFKRTLILQAKAAVLAEPDGETVTWPSYSLLCDLIETLQAGHPVTKGNAKTRESISSRPKVRFAPREITRAGEAVQMDTTVVDVFCIDRVSGRVYRPELTVLFDVKTRLILASCMVEHTTAEDVAALIANSVKPSRLNADWGPKARWPYLGLPSRIHTGRPGPGDLPLNSYGTPIVMPETIIVDNGAPFLAAHVRSATADLSMSIEPTRPYTGTDKPQGERFWGTSSRGCFSFLPGYCGPWVASRGKRAEEEAYFFVDELHDIFREWVARFYHVSPHMGTNVPEAGVSRLSPIEMYNLCVAKAGLIVPQANPDFWMRLLPYVARKITAGPIQVNGLSYDSPVLAPYKDLRSPEKDGKWTFHYDKQDLRQIYFMDRAGKWHEIPWVNRDRVDVPFGGDALDFVRKLNLNAAVKKKTVDREILSLVQKWRLGRAESVAERKAATRMDMYLRGLLTESSSRGKDSPVAPVSTIASDALHARKAAKGAAPIPEPVQEPTEVIVEGDRDEKYYDDLPEPDYDLSDFLVEA